MALSNTEVVARALRRGSASCDDGVAVRIRPQVVTADLDLAANRLHRPLAAASARELLEANA